MRPVIDCADCHCSKNKAYSIKLNHRAVHCLRLLKSIIVSRINAGTHSEAAEMTVISWTEGGVSHKSVHHLCSCGGLWEDKTVIWAICEATAKCTSQRNKGKSDIYIHYNVLSKNG